MGDSLLDIRYGIYTEPDYLDDGTDFIRALNLEELAIEGEVLKVKPAAVPSPKYLLKPGDVLIVRSGANVGNAGVVVDRFAGATFGSYTIRVRLKHSINPFVFYVFLKSKFGRSQTVRFRTGLAQPNINIPNLRLLQVIEQFPERAEKNVENLVKLSHQCTLDSDSLYLKAERLVLDAIGWDKLNLSQSKWWAVPLSRANGTHRLDAEHFQPKYDRLVTHLQKLGKAKRLKEVMAEPIQKGVTPDYDEEGSIAAINSQHLGRSCLNFDAVDRTTEDFWRDNKRAQIRHHDVMTYATGAHIGRSNTYLETVHALAGVDILLVRPGKECDPIYLAVFLNSPAGLMQSKQFASGSGQAHIYPDNVASYWVALPAPKNQEQVAALVQESYTARQKAKKLLAEAKAKVEALIEGRG